MGKILKGINWLIGGLRLIVAGFFGTIIVLILWPTLATFAEALEYGIFMLMYGEFWLLLAMFTAIISISTLIAKVVVPDIQGE